MTDPFGENAQLVEDVVISGDTFADTLAGMQHRTVVSAPEGIPDGLEGGIGELTREMDGDLAGPGDARGSARRR